MQIELAGRYFQWTGPATVAEFQWFSALSGKAAKLAVEPLRLETLDGERLILPEHREAFEAFQVPRTPQYVLVGGIDGICLLRRNLQSLLDAADAGHPLLQSSGKGVLDLPDHGIFDRGRLVGLWEYDPGTQSIAWSSFIPRNPDLAKAVERMEVFVRDQLEDARSFSLDSPKSRIPRIEALRRAQPVKQKVS